MMQKIDLHGIKPSNAKSVLSAISSREQTSRAEVAAVTGLSLMTVGKVVDLLLDAGVVLQEKETRMSAGRRAGLLTLNSRRYSVVLDLSESAFRMNIIDITLSSVHTVTFRYNREFYYDENLYLFLKQTKEYIDSHPELSDNYGIGITIPGMYISSDDKVANSKIPELGLVPIRATAERILERPVSLIMKNVEAAAKSNITLFPDYRDRVIIYMFMGESVDGALCDHGSFTKGAHEFECDFGRMILRFGETLEERIRASTNDYMMADELSSAVYNIITILDPDAFIIESDLPREPEIMTETIKESLLNYYKLPPERMPKFITGGFGLRHCARGVAMALREMWMDSIL